MASGFKKFLGQVLPIAGAVTGNPFLAAAGGAAGGAINGGTRGALQGAALGGGSSFLGNKLFGSGGGGGGNPLKGLGSLGNLFGGGGGGNPGPTPTTNRMSPLGFTNPGLANQAIGQQSSQGGGLSKFLSNPLLLGLGTMAGSQLIRSPQVPELPQSVLDFQNQARSGNPLQNQAQQALMQQLGQTQQDLSQDEINAINRQYDMAQEDELKSIDSMYKSLRPGTDPLTDSAYQKDLGRVRDRYATLRADSVAGAQRQISNDFASQRANQIAQAAGLSQQQLGQLAQLSQYDLERALAQFNIQDRDKEYLRNYLFETGGQLVNESLFPQQSLFGE